MESILWTSYEGGSYRVINEGKNNKVDDQLKLYEAAFAAWVDAYENVRRDGTPDPKMSRIRGLVRKTRETEEAVRKFRCHFAHFVTESVAWAIVLCDSNNGNIKSRVLRSLHADRVALLLTIIPAEFAILGEDAPNPLQVKMVIPTCKCDSHLKEGLLFSCDQVHAMMYNVMEVHTALQGGERKPPEVIENHCGSYLTRCCRRAHPEPDSIVIGFGLPAFGAGARLKAVNVCIKPWRPIPRTGRSGNGTKTQEKSSGRAKSDCRPRKSGGGGGKPKGGGRMSVLGSAEVDYDARSDSPATDTPVFAAYPSPRIPRARPVIPQSGFAPNPLHVPLPSVFPPAPQSPHLYSSTEVFDVLRDVPAYTPYQVWELKEIPAGTGTKRKRGNDNYGTPAKRLCPTRDPEGTMESASFLEQEICEMLRSCESVASLASSPALSPTSSPRSTTDSECTDASGGLDGFDPFLVMPHVIPLDTFDFSSFQLGALLQHPDVASVADCDFPDVASVADCDFLV